MRSMTGYGHFFFKSEKYDIEIEVKSVNSRNLDLNINTDSVISHLDSFVREKISEIIKRGRVGVKIYVTDKQEQNLELNKVYLQRLVDLHNDAQQITGTKEKINTQDFLRHDGVLIRRISKINDECFLESLSAALDSCLENYDVMTRQEGAKMKSWIGSSIIRVKEAIADIEGHIPYYRNQIKEKLTKAVEELITKPLGQDIEKRLMAEISLYMDKSDITEEIVRFNDHIQKVDKLMEDETEETGRKLNFIFQEMHREIQTIGSKFNVVRVFPSVLLIKEEIEKCRELVQNVE